MSEAMTLRIPFEGFVGAVKRHLNAKEAYVFSDDGKTVLTAGDKGGSLVIACYTRRTEEEARQMLNENGLEAYTGAWSVNDDSELFEVPYVAAVSYRASKTMTGVWVDAYSRKPSEADVLERMYSEFKQDGTIGDVTLEGFITSAQLNVQIVTPEQIEKFAGDQEL
jgi:hypothetical protein